MTSNDFFTHKSSFIDEGAKIGSGTKIWHFCHVSSKSVIGMNCSIGQNVFVADNVSIGNNVKIQNNVSIYGGVTLKDDVFCGPSCVFTNVSNPRSAIDRRGEYIKTIVERGVSIGANATIVCGNKLGKYSFIAAGAVVTKNVSQYSLMAGVPAKRIGWMSKDGGRLDSNLVCPISNKKYKLNTENVLEEE